MIERRSKLTPSSARRIRVRPSAAARKLDAYYTSRQRKDDYAMDEAGTFPDKLKRGVLSQDGIWNLLERNRELTRKLGISEVQGHDEYE